MTRTLHLQHRVAAVRPTYGSNPSDVAARLERGAHMQLPGTRRVGDQTRQSREPVASHVAERRDDGVRQPIRNSKRSRHASGPLVCLTLDYAASSGIISPSTTIYCSLRWNLLTAGLSCCSSARKQPPAESVSAHARFQESYTGFEFGHPLLEGLAARTLWIRRAHIPEVRGAAPRFLPRERLPGVLSIWPSKKNSCL
jgi:hypothetical protein